MGGVAQVVYPKEFYIPVMDDTTYQAMKAVAIVTDFAPAILLLNTTDNKLYYACGRQPYQNYPYGEAYYKEMPVYP